MAELGRFFDGPAYGAQAHAEFYTNFLSTGFFMGLEVSANDSMEVTVSAGSAFLEGHEYRNTDNLNLEHNIADSTNDRIDRIVIRLDNTPEAERPLRAMVRSGMPNSNPEPPELVRNDAVYEISLAQVLIEAGKSFIENYQITDERGDIELCGRVSQPTVLTDQVGSVDVKRPGQRASDYVRGHSVFYVHGTDDAEILQEWLDSVGFDPSSVGRSLSAIRAYVETNAQRNDTGIQTVTIFDWAQGWDYQIYGKFTRTSNSAFSAATDWGSWHEEVLELERGETSSGLYIRYTNGIQECWVTASGIMTASTYSSTPAIYWGQWQLVFPAPFIEIPKVSPNIDGGASGSSHQIVPGIRSLDNDMIDIYGIAFQRENAQGLVSVYARGRWRE